MAIEIERPKEDRGAAWVWVQAALFLGYLYLSPIGTPHWDSGALGAGVLLMGWGAMFALGAMVTMVRHHGWRNITSFPKPLKGLTLITDGAFAYVRHPSYFGILLMLLGYSVFDQNIPKLVVVVILAVFFDLKSAREETFLRAAYPGYEDYVSKVKRLFPGLY